MSAASEILNDQSRSRAISVRRLINAHEDLIWFIGSVASSYLLLILYVNGVLPLIPMVAGWAMLIDAPHVFGTFSRESRSTFRSTLLLAAAIPMHWIVCSRRCRRNRLPWWQFSRSITTCNINV